MRIGLTYDLKDDYLKAGFSPEACAEFDGPETIDALEACLRQQGHAPERIGSLQPLVRRLGAGDSWDLVFNIAEGMHGRAREAQVPAILDAFRIPYVFSDPLILALTLDKPMTKRVVRDAGLPTAAFCVLQDESALRQATLPAFPLFLKPAADGTGRGIGPRSLVHGPEELRHTLRDLLARFGQPVLAESYLPGREFTVGVTGTAQAASVIGVMEICLNGTADACGYTYENKQQYETRVSYRLADDPEALKAGETALAAWKLLQCRDGGRLDLRSDAEGIPHFLEVNPLAGLHPELGDLVILSRLAGVPYDALLGRIMGSALADPTRFPLREKAMLHA